MCTNDCMINPLWTMKHNIEQIEGFYKDIVELDEKISEVDYGKELLELRDDTERLRAEYSILYAKLLEYEKGGC